MAVQNGGRDRAAGRDDAGRGGRGGGRAAADPERQVDQEDLRTILRSALRADADATSTIQSTMSSVEHGWSMGSEAAQREAAQCLGVIQVVVGLRCSAASGSSCAAVTTTSEPKTAATAQRSTRRRRSCSSVLAESAEEAEAGSPGRRWLRAHLHGRTAGPVK